ncbi:replication protein A 70 kDa DNA-binding subunit-like [Biomphalaria glabrata]|uniref:Replication protein A subunit n=1 Tax=Biomphalaria glabrata TaxID=6526 RepID=A0A9U8EM70_BIOGL|nr:replication protein A 70 kDa DNA-binding subunit-like [Biomphalaria glabrata]KAI8787409.1 replication protein A 70 kDa DNA-binding subunit [Biomphalaria glabrata]
MKLSNNAILQILHELTPENPKFQVINAKKIESAANSVDRYRLLLSDGDYLYSHVMLAAQLNRFMESNEITNYAVIEVTKYMCNKLAGDKRVIIILDLKVLASGADVGEKIGNPTVINPSEIPPLSSLKEDVPEQKVSLPTSKPLATNNHFGKFGGSNPENNNQKLSKPSTPSTPSSRVHSITSLTPYQNRWRIRARVTFKSNIRTWSNSKGEGKLFNVNLIDESGEIRCTGFNEQLDKFYDMLEVNKVYYFSKCSLKTANKQYSNLKCDYEMTMNAETIIEPCNDGADLPSLTFEFVKISELDKFKPNSNVDIVGIVKVCNDVSSVVSKQTQKEIVKRDLQLVDQSGVAVNLTLWGDDATKFDGQGFPVIAVKGARVSDFNGRSLSVSGSSQLIVNPGIPEAFTLRGWFENEGRDHHFSTFQGDGGSGAGHSPNYKTFIQVKNENLGQGEKADYYTAKGTVMFIKKDNCMYQACPTADCNKKLVDQGNGHYRCEKCNREFPNYKWRMILNANVADHTDNQWITCFQESAEALLGIPADELGEMREKDESQFDRVINEALFKNYLFKLRAKVETYNDESRLKTVCMAANPVNYIDYGNLLLERLSQLGI